MKRVAWHSAWAVALVAALMALAATPAAESWKFQVLLDGKPIGTHTLTLSGDGERRELRSTADFAVKFIGITAYHYQHTATEHWQGHCLAALTASTDDNGKKTRVEARQEGTALAVNSPAGTASLPGCVMSFAYWQPEMLRQQKLLNPQTGKYEAVQVRSLGESKLEWRGATVAARHYRIEGPEEPLELWYSAEGDWLQLESSVGGRKLSYRRQ